jgi:hypothetical protein
MFKARKFLERLLMRLAVETFGGRENIFRSGVI